MLKKQKNNVYLNENEELETHKILLDGKAKRQTRGDKRNSVWGWLRPVLMVAMSIILVVVLVNFAYSSVKGKYLDPVEPGNNEVIEVTIEKGSSLKTISQALEDNGVVRSATVFKLYADFSDMASKLRAGKYALTKSMNYDDIIYALSKGDKAASTVDVRFREGLSATDFAELIVKAELAKSPDRYLQIAKTGEGFETAPFVAEIIAQTNESGVERRFALEGYLFPDTYQYYSNAPEEDVIKKQLDRFVEIFTEEYAARAEELDMSVDEVITLASIIEKEAKKAQFAQVSAVFHNRLKRGMPLESDATIAYALGVKRINLTDPELNTPSPYNTHLNKGLPVGPICNPGKAAIEAALYPDKQTMSDGYIFFTLTDPDKGELAFSKTNEEHQAIVDQWKGTWEALDQKNAQANNGQ